MLNSNYICALDIGSSKIAAVVAEIRKRNIANIFLEVASTKGIRRGAVIDSIELTNTADRLLNNLKTKSGINIKFLYTNISGEEVITKHSRAIIPLAERGNKVITPSDVARVNEQARILGSSLEEEIIHQIPFSYTIDSKSNILTPLGLYSHKLEVDLYLVCGKLSLIQNLNRAIAQAGFEIKKLFFSGLATSKVVFNQEFKEGVDILCDIGSDITEILIFHDGVPRDIRIVPMGGDNLTLEIARVLKIPFNLAEDVKKSHGAIGDYTQIKEDKEILIKKDNIYKPIKQKAVSEILTTQAELICDHIRKAIADDIELSQINNFLAVGRTILTEGFLERLEGSLGIPVKLGRITRPDIVSLMNKDSSISSQQLSYITALGMICEALEQRGRSEIHYISQPNSNPILRAINKIRDVYQEYF